MTPQALSRLSELFDQALALAHEQRADWLQALHGADAELRPKLQSMLDRLHSTDTAELPGQQPAALLGPAGPQPGDSVGPYRLLRRIGSGGMGTVWLAERSDASLRRQVALKLPHLGWAPGLAQRFARERDILSSLAHVHIARLYDAGVDALGRPYMALEVVDGLPITDYAQAHALGAVQRVKLLRQVMDAVQYAHANLVIHRDLKPSNVLVTATGQAMLLDFGIAKLLQDSAGEAAATELTQVGGRALTLDYAAPEQVAGTAVSIATDVYALGVLLYELIGGQRPHQGVPRSELERAVLSADPAAPGGGLWPTLPRSRAADLTTLILKALKKAPAERYATVAAMAEDLDRWLRGDAIAARGDSPWYRLQRLVARHRLPVAAAGAVLLALFAGLSVALLQARQARQEAARANAVQEFVLNLFRANSAEQAEPERARQTTARELLAQGARRIDSPELAQQPEARVALLDTLASLHVELGLWSEAEALSTRQVEESRRLYGPNDERLADAMIDLASTLELRDEVPNARIEQLLSQAGHILDAARDDRSLTRARWHYTSGTHALERSLEVARQHAQSSIRILQATTPARPLLVQALELNANIDLRQGRSEDARHHIDEALALARQLQLPPYRLGDILNRAGEIHSFAQDVAGADSLLREALALSDRINGPQHTRSIVARRTLARHLAWTARLAEARVLADEALAQAGRPRAGRDTYLAQETRRIMFDVYWAQGDLPATWQLLDDAFQTAGGADSFQHADLLGNRAMVRLARGELAGARADLDAARAMAERIGLQRGSRMRNNQALIDIEVLVAAGRFEQALQAVAEQRRWWPDDDPETLDERTALRGQWARSLLALGRSEEAEAVAREALAQVLASPNRAYLVAAEVEAHTTLGDVLRSTGRCSQAQASLARAAELLRQQHVAASPWRARAEAVLGLCLLRSGQRAQAVAALKAATASTPREPNGADLSNPVHELKKGLERP